jgi:hypothetical protein
MAKEFMHNKKHDIDSDTDHNSSITTDNLISADANGLPKDAGVASSNVVKHNFTATSVPQPSNDNTEGYSVGSKWYYVAARKMFICFNTETGSAEWKLVLSNGLVRNVTGDTLPQLYVVRPGTPSGGNLTVELAKADEENTSRDTFGVILDAILDNEFGYIIDKQQIYNVDSSGTPFGEVWADDNVLYLSAANAGYLTKTKPASPNHLVIVGKVVKAHAEQGIIHFDIANGFETWELHDVDDTPPDTDMQVKTWDTARETYKPDDVISDNKNSGLVSWGGAGDYFSITADKFKILRAGTGRIWGKLISWAADQETATLSANTANYIYIDSAGAIQSTTTRSGTLFEDNIVLFIDLFDGTNHVVVREDHPFKYDTSVSNDTHDTIGTVLEGTGADIERVTTGTGSVATDRQLKIAGADELHDHGLETDIPDSGGSAITINHYNTNASGKFVRDSQQASFPMKYNNAGTPTTLGEGKSGVYRVYVSKDNKNSSTPQYFSLMHTEEFANIQLARAAIASGVADVSGELYALEMAHLGYVIVTNNASGGYIQERIIEKDVAGGSRAGGGSATSAALVSVNTDSLDKVLSSADSNVQAALETLDEAGASVGDVETGTSIAKFVTPDALAGSNLGERIIEVLVTAPGDDVATGDGVAHFTIPSSMAGMNLVRAQATVVTPGTTGATTVNVHNVTDAVDMLSANISIASAANVGTPGTVDTGNDDVTTDDRLRIDVDTVSTTAPKGLVVILEFRLP